MDYQLLLAEQLHSVLAEHLSVNEIKQLIEVPKDTKMGDLAFPVFTLARVLRKAPPQIAQELVAQLQSDAFDSIEAVGPYINVRLKRAQVAKEIVSEVFNQGADYGTVDLGHQRVMTVDMSSPNIAKPMSMGHLRSTVIGNAIVNLAQKTNYQTVRINHLGDWGTQFGKLIVAYKLWGDDAIIEADPVNELVKLYVDFHEKAETQPELEEQARAAFKALEDGDAEMIRLWTWFKDESLKEFTKVYELLDIKFDSYNGEAFYNDKMQPIIDELESKGITTVDNGATIVKLDEEDLPPALIKKSDGATLYATRDLAAAQYRKDTYDFAKNVYVVGNEQSGHFKQLRAVLKRMGRDWAEDMIHVPFGLITLDGKKLSTRKGKIILLEQVLNDAIALAYKQIDEKNPTLANKEEVARQVGVGAVIFHDLKTDRMNSFDFKLEEIVQFEGETGPYVQYTHARAMSLIRKFGEDIAISDVFDLQDDYSWEVVKKLHQYPNVIASAMEKYEPSYVAKYAVQLAQLFNKYYGNTRILDEDAQRPSRLALVKAVTMVLKDALNLLGIQAPNEM
ncbi:arginine--tRNA ligase [Aerococcaceae bacterium zg-ZUI334]|uniref:arginine--tRNA ligase n=1 Tax=Aerococcaceae bacterium zg-252 TaxID=2796928 RepID=UPI001B926379|nr:arginine--tRNA ligase [Aerococcaceae bacterium zg-ZUI334]